MCNTVCSQAEGVVSMSTFVASDRIAAIRGQLDHPILDGDGHLQEFLPLVVDLIADEAGASIARHYQDLVAPRHTDLGPAERTAKRLVRTAFWGAPAAN